MPFRPSADEGRLFRPLPPEVAEHRPSRPGSAPPRPGLDIRLIEAECCGLGGLYGFKKEKYEIAEDIGKDLAKEVARIDPEVILTDCEGCRMQIRQLTKRKVLHPVQLLRDALDRYLRFSLTFFSLLG